MSINKILISIVGLAFLLTGACYAYNYFYGVPNGAYAAVVMVTGDVYFGIKSEFMGTGYLTLKEVYYPQSFANELGENEIRLVELGTELHKPETTMRINRDQILFIQKLQKDSPVISTINDYKAQQ
jgi:hypothetical protein